MTKKWEGVCKWSMQNEEIGRASSANGRATRGSRDALIVVMKKHGSNTENISHAVLRLGTKLWWLRAPLTFLRAT